MLQEIPTQMEFGQDAILKIPLEADWQMIRKHKQVLIKNDNACKNARQIPHAYNVGDKVLVTMDALDKYCTPSYKDPYQIMKFNDNGTIKIQMSKALDKVNIQCIHP